MLLWPLERLLIIQESLKKKGVEPRRKIYYWQWIYFDNGGGLVATRETESCKGDKRVVQSYWQSMKKIIIDYGFSFYVIPHTYYYSSYAI